MSDSFLLEYMNECISIGKKAPHEICECAKKEIKDIDNEIFEIEKLRNRQLKLNSIVRTLGGKARGAEEGRSPALDFNIPENKLDDYMRNLCAKICTFIEEKHPSYVTPRDIMDEVTSVKENKVSYTAIKWLWRHGIITRIEDNVSRPIVKGENWDKRPLA
jgi:hypothetical protein